jgi:hypothetical protein
MSRAGEGVRTSAPTPRLRPTTAGMARITRLAPPRFARGTQPGDKAPRTQYDTPDGALSLSPAGAALVCLFLQQPTLREDATCYPAICHYPVGRRRLLLEGSCVMSPQADTEAPASGMEPKEGLSTRGSRRLMRRCDPPLFDAGAHSIDAPRGVANILRQVATPQGDVRPRAHDDGVETRSLLAYPTVTS